MNFRSLLILILIYPAMVFADEKPFFGFEILNNRHRTSTYWFPLLGFPAPGLPQFLNGQTNSGFVYSGVAFAGLVTAAATYNSNDSSQTTSDFTKLSSQDEAFQWGLQTYQDLGFISVYHTFRSTVDQRRKSGDFNFLPLQDETPDQLFLSPFHIGYILEPSVVIPLGILAGGLILYHNSGAHGSPSFTLSDGLFTAGTSYNAGVSEESFFRGYLMMNFRQSWNSDFWSLSASSVLFSAAHISSENPIPWPQLLAGFYLGWLTQSNHWTLSRSVFFHTWWDVISIAAELTTYTVNQKYFLPVIDARF